jgi:hypothetical protein
MAQPPSLDERGLREIELARNGLHPIRREACRVHHHGQRVAGQRRAGKHIHDEILQLQ